MVVPNTLRLIIIMLTLILPIHIETPDDEAAVTAMLDSLEADSLSLCHCERLVLLSGTYSRQLRGRLHKMASRFIEQTQQTLPGIEERIPRIVDNERTASAVVLLGSHCTVEKGWLDRLVIEADRTGGVVIQGPATYYPKIGITT